MAITKNQYSRFKIINMCLSSKRKKYWKRAEILEEMSKNDIDICKRTLSTDLELMRYDSNLGFFAPIDFCPRVKGLYYTDSTYSTENLPLTREEFQTLANSLSFLKFKGAFKDFESVIDKLLRLGSQFTKNYDTSSIIDFEKAPHYEGEEHIDPLLNHVREKQPIKITYQKFDSENPSEYIIHPHYLKEYRNRWYVLSTYDKVGELRTFALDRIKAIEPLNIEYKECPLKNPPDHFRNILGITLEKGEIQEVILSFIPQQGPYLKTQPIHHSQQILIDDKEEFSIRLDLIPNYELKSLILSYGNQVKVISPISLKKEVEKMK